MGIAARRQAPREIVFAVPPLTFNRAAALTFTGISDKLFDQLERTGAVTGKKLGRNGEKVYLRDQLEAVTTRLFGAGATDIDDEFEGLGG